MLAPRSRALAALCVALVGSVSSATAEIPATETTSRTRPEFILAAVPQSIHYQGFVTDNFGTPLVGAHNFSVSLYNTVAAGVLQWGPEAHNGVAVSNGLFSLDLGSGTALPPSIFTQALFLEVSVDGTTLPRQPLKAVAYAFSLVPGAVVSGDPTSSYALSVTNTGAAANDRGVYASGRQYGLYAEEIGTGDEAIYSQDFVNALGYRSRSPSYLWVSPATGFLNTSSSTFTMQGTAFGNVGIRSIAAVQTATSFFVGISVPGELFGQAVTVEEVRYHYEVSNAASFISAVELVKNIDTDSRQILVTDVTDRTSTAAATVTLVPDVGTDNVITSASGFLQLKFDLSFANNVDVITLGGIRVRLGHILRWP